VHKLLGVYLPTAAAKFAVGLCNWNDSRPHKGLELLQVLGSGEVRCSVRVGLRGGQDTIDPLYASRLHYELEETLPRSSHHALRALHYAFAAVDDYNWCRRLATIDVVSWDDEQDLRQDVCKTIKHAVKTFLLRVVRK